MCQMVAFTTGAMLEHIIAARILQMDMPCPVDIDDVVFDGVYVKPERRQKQGLLFCLSGRTDFYVMVYPCKTAWKNVQGIGENSVENCPPRYVS